MTDSGVLRAVEPGDYRIDPGRSRFTARVGSGGPFAALGHDHTIAIRDLGGEIRLLHGAAGPISLSMTIQADSLVEIGEEFDDKERQKVNRAMRERALETARYPDIRFESTRVSMTVVERDRVYDARIEGTLELHGVRRPIAVPARVQFEGKSLRAEGRFTVLHTDYGMQRISVAGGAVKAKDAIELAFEIVAETR